MTDFRSLFDILVHFLNNRVCFNELQDCGSRWSDFPEQWSLTPIDDLTKESYELQVVMMWWTAYQVP